MQMTELDVLRARTLGTTEMFTRYHFKHRFNKKFIVNWHHTLIAEHLDKVFSGEIKKLAIRIAPRYGKTELAVKNFIAKGLAQNPASKFIHLSYSGDLALDNSEEIREFIQEEEFRRLYPWVEIDKASTAKKKWYTTAGGGVYATATGGQITGFGAGEMDELEELESELDEMTGADSAEVMHKFAGAIVIDDPLKPDDADSEVKRERINERFENTIRSRTNSRNTPIIIIGQAVHERDLIGYLMETEPDEWTVLTIPAIQQNEEGEDVALWPFKHSLKELYKLRDASPRTFDSQYQQDPKDLLGLLLPIQSLKFGTITDENPTASLAFIDPADKGGDKFSAIFVKIFFFDSMLLAYVHDVLHNTDGIQAGAQRVSDRIDENAVDEIFVETNGLGLALVLELKKIKNENCKLTPITSRDPKEVRILSGFEAVPKYFLFDEKYKENREFRAYIKDLTSYKKDANNTHKADAMDVTTQAANILKLRYRATLYPGSK